LIALPAKRSRNEFTIVDCGAKCLSNREGGKLC
jgi:hypothetical protein